MRKLMWKKFSFAERLVVVVAVVCHTEEERLLFCQRGLVFPFSKNSANMSAKRGKLENHSVSLASLIKIAPKGQLSINLNVIWCSS